MKKITFIALLSILCVVACKKQSVEVTEVTTVTTTDSVSKPTGNELKIVAIIKVKPQAVKDIMPIFEKIVSGSQKEEGCIYYNLHQDTKDSTRFVMLEEWKSQDAIDFHNNTEHFKAFKEAAKDKIESSEVTVIKTVEM